MTHLNALLFRTTQTKMKDIKFTVIWQSEARNSHIWEPVKNVIFLLFFFKFCRSFFLSVSWQLIDWSIQLSCTWNWISIFITETVNVPVHYMLCYLLWKISACKTKLNWSIIKNISQPNSCSTAKNSFVFTPVSYFLCPIRDGHNPQMMPEHYITLTLISKWKKSGLY